MLDDGNCPGFSFPSSTCGDYVGEKRNNTIVKEIIDSLIEFQVWDNIYFSLGL